jgi:CubicO group peptidase (beta-lactamase class C family)
VKFLQQPAGVAWPTLEWDVGGDAPASVLEASDALFAGGVEPPAGEGISLGLIVVHRGRIVHERYGTQPDTPFGPGAPVDRDTTLISWSMAKSITHAAVGCAVDDGRLDPAEVAAVTDWAHDDRRTITLDDLLRMRDGLDFVEEYVTGDDAPVPHVIDMLFGVGADDVAGYTAARPLKHRPSEFWNYSSGTTNIVSRLLGDQVGHGDSMNDFLRTRVFAPIGMSSATPKFDTAGTFIGSSFVYATTRDFARFGYLYLRGGEWDGRRIVSSSWVDAAAEQHAADPDTGHGYGRHWWIWKSQPGVMAALGYEGQRTIADTTRDVVIVHLGKWTRETQPLLDERLDAIRCSFPLVAG